MAKRARSENLFENTTMTFGEHLEELRVCLWRSLFGLAMGFLIGLLASGSVVRMIQRPLNRALVDYYQLQTTNEMEERLEEFEQAGYRLPEDRDSLAAFVAQEGLMPEEILVNPREIAIKLQQQSPEAVAGWPAVEDSSDSQFSRDNLVPLFVWRHIEEKERTSTTALSAHEPFAIFIKAALVVGIVIASPWIFYQIWAFVAAGLYPHEKRYIHVFLPASLGLFLAGAAMAFLFVIEPVLKFLFLFNDKLGIAPDLRISEWTSFVLMLPLGFGISFQLPLVMLFLERIGIFSVEAYLEKWRMAILAIFVVAMFLTPADPTSMLLMAAPLTLLYFGGILLCRLLPRPSSPYDDIDDEEMD